MVVTEPPVYGVKYCDRKGGEKMTKKRYLMINIIQKACKNGYRDVLRDLITIPEVQFIEKLDGIFDLAVQVECPVGIGYAAADDLLAKGWVERLQVLQAEPAESREIITPPGLELQKELIQATVAAPQL
jgi:hypothetical protein